MISLNESQFVSSLLQQNFRHDGRQSLQSRQISAQFMQEYGCLLFHQGYTTILIKTKLQIIVPKKDKPTQGYIEFKINNQCSLHTYQYRKKIAIQIQKMLNKILIGSLCLDLQSLCIISGKFVWKLIISSIVIVDDGNIIDTILNGILLSLMDVKKPFIKVQKQSINIDKNKLLPLSLSHLPISFTIGCIENNIFLDPTYLEQSIQKSRITVSLNIYEQICSLHKLGGMPLSNDILNMIVNACCKRIKKATHLLREIAVKRNSIKNKFL